MYNHTCLGYTLFYHKNSNVEFTSDNPTIVGKVHFLNSVYQLEHYYKTSSWLGSYKVPIFRYRFVRTRYLAKSYFLLRLRTFIAHKMLSVLCKKQHIKSLCPSFFSLPCVPAIFLMLLRSRHRNILNMLIHYLIVYSTSKQIRYCCII